MKIFNFDVLDSTNEYMKKNYNNFSEYDVVVAKNQTAGKARCGNFWVSNEGMALFTFMINKKENISDEEYLKIPLISGLSVIKALNIIEKSNYMFKWTNDIYFLDKKLCGILVEKYLNNYFIGIGININNTIPNELKDKAVSLFEITNKNYEIQDIIIKIINEFKILYNKSFFGLWNEIIEEINSLNYLKNKKVHLKIGNKITVGIAKNIDNEGKIEILIDNNIKSFSIGEITKIFF